jgi:Protein of unknown function (DUF1344)
MLTMLSASVLAVSIAVLVAAPAAWAETFEGKIRSVDQVRRVVTLEDGTQVTIPDNLRVDRKSLEPGAIVKVSYQVHTDANIVTGIQVQPGPVQK